MDLVEKRIVMDALNEIKKKLQVFSEEGLLREIKTKDLGNRYTLLSALRSLDGKSIKIEVGYNEVFTLSLEDTYSYHNFAYGNSPSDQKIRKEVADEILGTVKLYATGEYEEKVGRSGERIISKEITFDESKFPHLSGLVADMGIKNKLRSLFGLHKTIGTERPAARV